MKAAAHYGPYCNPSLPNCHVLSPRSPPCLRFAHPDYDLMNKFILYISLCDPDMGQEMRMSFMMQCGLKEPEGDRAVPPSWSV